MWKKSIKQKSKYQAFCFLLLQRFLHIISGTLEQNLIFHPLHKNQNKESKTKLLSSLTFPRPSPPLSSVAFERECNSQTMHRNGHIIWTSQAYTNPVCVVLLSAEDVVGSWAVLLRTPEHFYPLCVGQWAPPGGKQPPGLMICMTCIVWPPWGVGVTRGWVI